MTLSRRKLLLGTGVLISGWAFGSPARASSSLALSVSQLSRRASRVVLGTPQMHDSEWATVAGSRRIITRTRFVQRSDWLRGKTPDDVFEDEFFVVTLGGRVGRIAQKIPGEAALPLHEPLLLFLRDSGDHKRIVGMSQGSYSISQGEATPHLQRARNLPELIGEQGGPDAPIESRPAVQVLHGATLSRAFSLIRGSR